jgi:hypothetical protein
MNFVERMRWWHWVLLSLALGALLGYLNSGGADAAVDHTSASAVIFETGMIVRPWVDPSNAKHEEPYISDVVIHPVQEVQLGGGKTMHYQLVSFSHFLPPDGTHKAGWHQIEYYLAPFPYQPTPRNTCNRGNQNYPGANAYQIEDGDTVKSLAAKFYPKDPAVGERAIIAANPHLREAKAGPDVDAAFAKLKFVWIPWDPKDQHTVSDFLVATNQFLKTRDANNAIPVSFQYRWWESSKYGFQMWMVGTFLIVGVIWPTLLAVMIKGGLGKMTPAEYDLGRFKGGPEPDEPKPVPVTTTADDMKRLHDLEESLEASLKAGATVAPAAEAATAVAAPPEIKKLTGGDPAKEAAPPVPEEKKDYEGEFYPVAHPHKKTDEKK